MSVHTFPGEVVSGCIHPHFTPFIYLFSKMYFFIHIFDIYNCFEIGYQ